MSVSTTSTTTVATTVIRLRTPHTRSGPVEAITRATYRVDCCETGMLGELLAQAGDINFDDIGIALEIVTPDSVEDVSFRQHLPGAVHEKEKHVKLTRGDANLLLTDPHPMDDPMWSSFCRIRAHSNSRGEAAQCSELMSCLRRSQWLSALGSPAMMSGRGR